MMAGLMSYVPALMASAILTDEEMPALIPVNLHFSDVTAGIDAGIVSSTTEVCLADYVPKEEDRNKYRARIDAWSNCVARESAILDEREWMRPGMDATRTWDLSALGVFHHVKLHNRMLSAFRLCLKSILINLLTRKFCRNGVNWFRRGSVLKRDP